MIRRTLAFTPLLLLIISSCGKNSSPSSESPSNQIHASLKLEDFTSGECLNLEKFAAYLNQEQFNFPARRTTLSYSSTSAQTALFIRNFENQYFQLSTLPFFRNPRQTDCNQVEFETAYGRKLIYNITEYDNRSLTLEASPFVEAENIDEVIREAYSSEPSHSKISISLESPTSLRIHLDSKTLLARCGIPKSVSFTKTMMYRWASRPSDLPQTENLPYSTIETVRNLLIGSSLDSGALAPSADETSSVNESENDFFELQISDLEQLESELAKLELQDLCD